MPARILVSVVVWSSVTFRVVDGAAAEHSQAVNQLEQLAASIETIVPQGWDVEIIFADPNNPERGGAHPTIVIKSARLLVVEHSYPGMPDSPTGEVELSGQIVALHFVAVPYMSEEEYITAWQNNELKREKRLRFAREHLKGIPLRAQKRPGPYPPTEYKPSNDNEAQLLRQYAFLWLHTEPQTLPTHHSGSLSFRAHYPSHLRIVVSKYYEEYGRILTAVNRIIVPYTKPP